MSILKAAASLFTLSGVCTAIAVVVVATALLYVFDRIAFRLAPKRSPPRTKYPEHDKIRVEDGKEDARVEYDVCIVGGGVVGAALAAVLGRNGTRVAVVERDLTEPDRIVGELLQPSGVEKLKQLGLYDTLTGIDAQSVPGYGIVLGRDDAQRIIELPYPLRAAPEKLDEQKYEEKFTGRGLHNGRFVMNLRKAAAKNKSVELIQGNVMKLLQRDDGRVTGVVYRPTVAGAANANLHGVRKAKDANANATVRNANGNANGNGEAEAPKEVVLRAGLTVVVDGCFSMFRRPIFEPKIIVRSKFLGLVLKDCELPVKGCGNVILADPSPVLVYPISSSETRMLIDFPEMPEDDEALMRHFKTVIEPQLPEKIRPSFRAAIAEGKWQTMPNQSLATECPNVPIGALVVGDALNMRHPLTGGGMTVGFTDVELLSRLFKPVQNWHDHAAVHAIVTKFYDERRGRSAVINILADALYQVFLAKNPDLRNACYDYLSGKDAIGRLCYEGPIALLSGLNRSQSFLVMHFFSVALFGVGRLFVRGRFRAGSDMFREACRIILPLLVQENTGLFARTVYKTAQIVFFL